MLLLHAVTVSDLLIEYNIYGDKLFSNASSSDSVVADYTFRADSFTANNGAAAPRFTVTADVVNTYKVFNTQIEFLHSPNTTNAITYKLMGYIPYGDFILNRGYTLDNASRSTGTSTITVKEIGA